MNSTTNRRMSRRSIAATAAFALLLGGVVMATGAAAHPTPEHGQQVEAGPGVKVNSPEELAGFITATHWDNTAPLNDQTSDLVYAGTGCTPLNYEGVDAEGKIVIIDKFAGRNPADQCPTFTFKQKMESAERAGAIGVVQVDNNEAPSAGSATTPSGIPGLEIPNSKGVPIRDAVIAGTAVNVTLTRAGALTEPLSNLPCVDGMAGPFPCESIDLLSFVPQKDFNGAGVSDIWGWTDPENGDEYVFFGKTNGTAFFRVTDPFNPVYLGELDNPGLTQGIWHDMKVYKDHVFIVSESEPHGMQVFDLTRLRGVTEPQEWTRDAWYRLLSAAHNIGINEETGFAYIVGGNAGIVAPDQCLSGLHMVDIRTPKNPTFAGCYLMDGGPGTAARFIGGPAEDVSPAAYVHDTECVIYEGPDERYTGREICFNAAEDKVVIADVTNKLLPTTVGTTDYPNVSYAHQGWLSDDQRFLFVNDELDEEAHGFNTRTIVLDVSDLENPKLHFEHFAEVPSIDHNNYVHEGLLYQSNYTSGLRVLNTAHVDDPQDPRLEQVAFFDTYPATDDPIFEGTWSNYPFFESGTIAVTGIGEGLFLLRLSDELLQPAVDIACVNCPIQMRAGGRRSAAMAVTNLGLVDDAYRLSVADVPAGWTVRIQRAPLAVEAGESKRTSVRIEVPAGTAPGTYGFIVTATSTLDPAVSASEQVDVIVQG